MWDEYIKEADIFVIFFSKDWLEDARGWLEYEYAKENKKPVRVFLRGKQRLPEGFGGGVEDFQVKSIKTIDELSEVLEKWKEKKVKYAITGWYK